MTAAPPSHQTPGIEQPLGVGRMLLEVDEVSELAGSIGIVGQFRRNGLAPSGKQEPHVDCPRGTDTPAIVGPNNTLARVLGGDPVLMPKNWEEPIRPLASAKEYEPRIWGDHGDGLADSPAAKLASS